MSTIAILQSNYLPWKGYFDLIDSVDTFVIYDIVQYTKNDWRNRNRIKTPTGSRWITVPVRHLHLGQPIDEVEVADRGVLCKHWMTITQNYRKAAGFREMKPVLEPLFDRESPELLSDLNVDLLRAFTDLLGIDTEILSAADFTLGEDRNERLVEICDQAGASRYLSGPAARSYLDEPLFEEAGIDVAWMDYEGYPEYDQPHPPFDHYVSIVDLVLSAGSSSADLIRKKR
ncbi:MAG: WbqC family protein [Nocardioides sp.]|uniref:WbqC family protein n=1 Tax=Nocardioides sp. TaxID=35761 RepID=UPI003D6B9293